MVVGKKHPRSAHETRIPFGLTYIAVYAMAIQYQRTPRFRLHRTVHPDQSGTCTGGAGYEVGHATDCECVVCEPFSLVARRRTLFHHSTDVRLFTLFNGIASAGHTGTTHAAFLIPWLVRMVLANHPTP